MFHLLKRIARDYRVTLLSFLETDSEKEFLPAVESLCERVITMQRHPAPRLQLFYYAPFDEFLTPLMEAALRECLQNYDYELIQLEFTQMACYADRSLGIPILLTKHEVEFAACARRARLESHFLLKLRWFYTYLHVLEREIKLLRRTDTAICMTDVDAQELRRFCSSVPIEVINTGVDLEYFNPPAEPAMAPRLVFVGAFSHSPNVDAMIFFCRNVLPLIRSQVPSVEMLIVGSEPTPAIVALGDQPGVKVTGFVEDTRPYLAASSVYVAPLRQGVGIRGKILEAWGMGLAVVATPVACAGLRFRDGGNLLVAESPQQFADRVVTLLASPALREQLGKNGRHTAEEHYSWETAAQKLDSLYRSRLRRRKVPVRTLGWQGTE